MRIQTQVEMACISYFTSAGVKLESGTFWVVYSDKQQSPPGT